MTRAAAPQDEIGRLIDRWSAGDESALQALIPLVYDDLRRMAHRHRARESPDHILDTTAIVHEAYMSLAEGRKAAWRNRAHFFAVASRVMRHVLVDYARRSRAEKRGGERVRVPLREDLAVSRSDTVEVLGLEEALEWLAERDPRMARVVECRFFGGMNVDEVAEVLGVSTRTVEREWTRARAHLYRALSETPHETADVGRDDPEATRAVREE